jgi:dipeptidyl aminopeptidase/acylaminoacyl peptidase
MSKLLGIIVTFLFFISLLTAQNLLNGPEDIVYDDALSRYLISNWVTGQIIAIDQEGNQNLYSSGLPHSHGMIVQNDTLYVLSNNRIYRLNLTTGVTIDYLQVPGASRLGHFTMSEDGNIFASDWDARKVFKINFFTDTMDQFFDMGSDVPLGLWADDDNNRIILLTFGENVPVYALDMDNGDLTLITLTDLNDLDAITRDESGSYYISSFSDGEIYRFDSDFNLPPQIVSSGHDGPSGLEYFQENDILGVTNYTSNSISLIELDGNPAIQTEIISVETNLKISPNPFNPTTRIDFVVPDFSESVQVVIFNSRGQIIKAYDIISSDYSSIVWNGKDNNNHDVAGGVYFCVVNYGSNRIISKMILLK